MDAELYARLTGSAGIEALCGEAIYNGEAPKEATGTYLIWQRVSGIPEPRALDEENDVLNARVQIDSYGQTYEDARALADAVKASLKNWRPETGVIDHVTLDNDGGGIRESDPALKTIRVLQEYIITYLED